MRVLLIGEVPDAVDFSDPSLPPGMTATKIQAGIDQAMQDMIERGWEADLCLIQPDESGMRTLEKSLSARTYDCIVIGGGIRIPPKSLLLFEDVINAVHRMAPHASIAFNSSPQTTADSAGRWARQ